MKKLILLILSSLLITTSYLLAQATFPRNGVADQREGLYAITNATIYKSWNEKLENATLVIRKGRVEAIGSGIPVPKDAVVVDASGKSVYPGFIDLYSDYGMPEKTQGDGQRGGGGMDSRCYPTRKGLMPGTNP